MFKDKGGEMVEHPISDFVLLCLPGVHGKANDSLMWQVDATALPAVGSKLTLRLRPRVKPALK